MGSVLWSTFYGGSDQDVGSGGCTVDASGNVFIHGYTWSTDFPVMNAAQGSHAGGEKDSYLVKFNSTGSVLWSTYYGGSSDDYGHGGCAVDATGNVFIHGDTQSPDFPVLDAYQESFAGGESDSYLVKFNSTGDVLWSTYYGGSSDDYGGGGCALDATGNLFIHGRTESTDFPVSNDSFQTANAGEEDAYLVKFSQSMSSLEEAMPVRLDIFPNPTTDYISIPVRGWAIVQVFSLSGNKVMEIQEYNGARIDLSGLPAGGYLVRVQGPGTPRAGIVIKQ